MIQGDRSCFALAGLLVKRHYVEPFFDEEKSRKCTLCRLINVPVRMEELIVIQTNHSTACLLTFLLMRLFFKNLCTTTFCVLSATQ